MRKDFYITEELYKDFANKHEFLCTLTRSMHDEKGHEVPNPKPMVIHTDDTRPLTLHEQIKRLFRGEMSRQVQRQGAESFDQADDFDVNDPFDEELNNSRYEVMTDEYPESDPTSGNASSNSSSQEKTKAPNPPAEATTDSQASE